LLSTAVVVAVDMEAAAAVEGTAADLAAAAIAAGLEAAAIAVGLEAASVAVGLPVDTAVAMQLDSQADTLWWVARAGLDSAADRTTLLALDTQEDFAVAMLAEASHPSVHTDT
jgi:acetyl-CoA acetyltransferase